MCLFCFESSVKLIFLFTLIQYSLFLLISHMYLYISIYFLGTCRSMHGHDMIYNPFCYVFTEKLEYLQGFNGSNELDLPFKSDKMDQSGSGGRSSQLIAHHVKSAYHFKPDKELSSWPRSSSLPPCDGKRPLNCNTSSSPTATARNKDRYWSNATAPEQSVVGDQSVAHFIYLQWKKKKSTWSSAISFAYL